MFLVLIILQNFKSKRIAWLARVCVVFLNTADALIEMSLLFLTLKFQISSVPSWRKLKSLEIGEFV